MDEELHRTFAGMLSELEDVATRLTARQSELARELADVQNDLQSVEKARAAMSGGASKSSRPSRTSPQEGKRLQADRLMRIQAWARERGNGEFVAAEAGEALGIEAARMGPIMAGMLRRGEVTVRDDGERRVYALTTS